MTRHIERMECDGCGAPVLERHLDGCAMTGRLVDPVQASPVRYVPESAVNRATSKSRYRTIVADPPWRYRQAGVTKADARKFYATMSIAEICGLDVLPMAEDDAHLWLWTTNALMEEGHRVVRAWGFYPLTIVTWCKPRPGVGHYLRNNTEHVILASRGKPLTPAEKPLSTWYTWPAAEHSRKPDAFYDLVEQVSPRPYLEMFARRARLGDWSYWGDESLGTAELVA